MFLTTYLVAVAVAAAVVAVAAVVVGLAVEDWAAEVVGSAVEAEAVEVPWRIPMLLRWHAGTGNHWMCSPVSCCHSASWARKDPAPTCQIGRKIEFRSATRYDTHCQLGRLMRHAILCAPAHRTEPGLL